MLSGSLLLNAPGLLFLPHLLTLQALLSLSLKQSPLWASPLIANSLLTPMLLLSLNLAIITFVLLDISVHRSQMIWPNLLQSHLFPPDLTTQTRYSMVLLNLTSSGSSASKTTWLNLYYKIIRRLHSMLFTVSIGFQSNVVSILKLPLLLTNSCNLVYHLTFNRGGSRHRLGGLSPPKSHVSPP